MFVIARIELGGALKENVRSVIAPNDSIFMGFDGLLGLSFLGDFKVTVDYKKGQIILSQIDEMGSNHRRVAVVLPSIIFLDTPERLCFYTPPFGENPTLGRREKATTMAATRSYNNLFWFYYFYASVCPLLRRT